MGGEIKCGLDMYLVRKHYIGGKYDFNNVEGIIDISIKGKKLPIDLKRLGYIDEDVGYWRKANQIHKWFVDNVQDGEDDGKYYYVDIDQLKELLELCKEVRQKARIVNGQIKAGENYEDGEWKPKYEEGKIIENAEEIAEILPTQDGFYFGSTEYDEWYMQDIYSTIEILEKILKEEEEFNKLGFYPEYEYRASW